jgi:hypothetical protein
MTVRWIEARSDASASCSGCSVKTTQCSDGIAARAVRTRRPWRSRAIVTSSAPASAAATWGSAAIVVFCSTRLMSGWATSAPVASTTYARPAWPILMRDTTSQMNLRFTSATTTPAPPICAIAMLMYGSDSLRKYTGPK